jgi:hypothetical protein
MSKRLAAIAVSLVGSIFVLGGNAAQAAIIGSTVTPSASTVCYTESSIQLRSPGMSYAVPFSGVITSWSYLAAGSPGQAALFVARVVREEHTALPGYPYNRAVVQEVGESESVLPPANLLSTYPTRIAVQAGDLIGLKPSSKGQCWAEAKPEYEDAFGTAPGVGGTANFSVREDNEMQVDVSARLEPDADGDGYGDETQDQCPTDASTQGLCPIPSAPTPSGSAPSSPSGGTSTGGQPEAAPTQFVCIPPKQATLKGKSLKQAKSAIRRAHCRVGQIIKKPNPRHGRFVVAKISTKNDHVNVTLQRAAKSRAHPHA